MTEFWEKALLAPLAMLRVADVLIARLMLPPAAVPSMTKALMLAESVNAEVGRKLSL